MKRQNSHLAAFFFTEDNPLYQTILTSGRGTMNFVPWAMSSASRFIKPSTKLYGSARREFGFAARIAASSLIGMSEPIMYLPILNALESAAASISLFPKPQYCRMVLPLVEAP